MCADKTSQLPPAADRSTKKAKFKAQGADGDNPSPLSFRDMLMDMQEQSDSGKFGRKDDWELEEDDVTYREEESMPFIAFSSKVHERLVEPWENSVVVKTLGRNLGYRVLSSRLNMIWSSTTGFEIIDLANDYFLIRFNNKKDVEYALTEGPWTVMGHYLSVQKWSPDFDVVNNKINHIVAWIRLSQMNIQFYHKSIIRRLGHIIGPVIKIDNNTITAQRGKFARLAVELDLQKPLVSQFNLEGRIQKVEYENLPTICFGCGKFGHFKDTCPDSADINIMAKDTPAPPTEAEGQAVVVAAATDYREPKFGSWMVVARQPRPRKVLAKDNPKVPDKDQHMPKTSQSRFGALEDLDIEGEISQDHDTDPGSQREPMMPISESIQILAPKPRSMKKKNPSQLTRKYPPRKVSITIPPSQPVTENFDPNIQIPTNYSHQNNQPPAMHGMHAPPKFSTSTPSAPSNAASTSMHGMHAYHNYGQHNPDPFPVSITLNPLHHSAVSFPKTSSPKAINHPPSQPVGDPSLVGEPPDKGIPNDPYIMAAIVEPEDSPVASRSGSPLSATNIFFVADSGIEIEAEALKSSR